MGLLEENNNLNREVFSDEELFKRSQSEPQLYAELLRRYQDAFLRKARMVMKTEERAEDVVSEVFTKLYLKASYFDDRGVGSFKSWAYKILMNTAFTHYQREKRGNHVEFSEEFAEVFPDFKEIDGREQRELADYISSVLVRLPEGFANVLNKFFLEGKSQEEIAAEEGVSVGAIKTKVYRAKEAFRNMDVTLSL